MNLLYFKAVLAGVLFGIYPLLLNRSKVSGNIMSATFCLIVCLCVLPFAVSEIKNLRTANWGMLLGAGFMSAIAMMAMTSFLSQSKAEHVAILITLMIILQAAVTAAYQIYMNKGVTAEKLFGFVGAAVSIYLLNKK